MMRVYISGPMRGFPQFNFPRFDAVAQLLRNSGVVVFNPSENDQCEYPDIDKWPGFAQGDTNTCPKFDLQKSLRWDFARILESNGIVMLPGWQHSVGAQAERYVAEVTGKDVYIWDEETQRAVLDFEQRRMAGPTIYVHA